MILFGKEVLVTLDLDVYQRASLVLHDAGIEYKTRKASNRPRGARGRRGSFGEEAEGSMLYYIYVKEADYEDALIEIGKC